MSYPQKFAQVAAATRGVQQVALAGIRARHPGIDEHEARLRLAALVLDGTTMLKAFGWAPNSEDMALEAELLDRVLAEAGP